LEDVLSDRFPFLYQSVDSQLQGVSDTSKKAFAEKARATPPSSEMAPSNIEFRNISLPGLVSCLLVAKQQQNLSPPLRSAALGKALEMRKDHVPNETCCQFF